MPDTVLEYSTRVMKKAGGGDEERKVEFQAKGPTWI